MRPFLDTSDTGFGGLSSIPKIATRVFQMSSDGLWQKSENSFLVERHAYRAILSETMPNKNSAMLTLQLLMGQSAKYFSTNGLGLSISIPR